jgi:hypothetical protein
VGGQAGARLDWAQMFEMNKQTPDHSFVMVWSRDFAMTVRLQCVVREVAVQCRWKRQVTCSCACCGQRKGSTAGLIVSSQLEAHGNHLTPHLHVQQPRHHHRRQHQGHGQRQTHRDCRATGGGAGIGTRSEDCDGLNHKCICEGVGEGDVGRGEGCGRGGSAASVDGCGGRAGWNRTWAMQN